MKINEIISERRKSLGITAKYIASQIIYRGKKGIRPATISQFEGGKHDLGSGILEQILDILQLSIQPITADAGREKENKTGQPCDVD